MKKTVKFLGLATLAMVFAVACNNNKAAEEDTICCEDTTLEVVDTTIEAEAIDTVTVAEEAPVVKKVATKKAEQPKTVQKASVGKPDAKEVASELKKSETNEVKPAEQQLGGKKNAKDAFKKN